MCRTNSAFKGSDICNVVAKAATTAASIGDFPPSRDCQLGFQIQLECTTRSYPVTVSLSSANYVYALWVIVHAYMN